MDRRARILVVMGLIVVLATLMILGSEPEIDLTVDELMESPDEYEGGELQFSYYSNNFTRAKPPAGTAVIFPAWVPHRVTPIKSGIRRSLVAWMDGPLFK